MGSTSSHTEPTNPLAASSSTYVADGEGWLRWLGESSTWSFSHKTLMLVRDHLHDANLPLPNIPLNEESRAYSLTWGSSGFEDPASFSNLPSRDHAVYLLNGVRFHLGSLYHLYDERQFMDLFHAFYDSPVESGTKNKIWYIQFLTLLALAKAISIQPASGTAALPGSEFFLRAIKMLPDPSYLISDALTAVEALCSIALYLQCADQRNAAYIYIGQAQRIAATFGLHRERPLQTWGTEVTERCHRAWWTVYILDRAFSSSMGVPISIQDIDITTPMPPRDGPRDSIAMFIHVKLSTLISDVVGKVYGAEGRLRSTFLPCVHRVLERIGSIASDLHGCFPLSYDSPDGSISRLAAHLHLFYHQIILLTVYPLLLYLFQAKLQGQRNNTEQTRTFSDTTCALLRTCGESCKNMIGVLKVLHQQSLLGGALPFDLERTFASGFVLVMLSFIFPDDRSYRDLYGQACQLLDEFISRGCRPARFRKGEVEQLSDMIQLWNSHSLGNDQNSNDAFGIEEVGSHFQLQHQHACSNTPLLEVADGGFYDLSPGQIFSLAQMIDVQEGHLQGEVDAMDNWMWHDAVERGDRS
ncbi:hypothetical protein FALCPG4_017969 [Fusarium falciforme]